MFKKKFASSIDVFFYTLLLLTLRGFFSCSIATKLQMYVFIERTNFADLHGLMIAVNQFKQYYRTVFNKIVMHFSKHHQNVLDVQIKILVFIKQVVSTVMFIKSYMQSANYKSAHLLMIREWKIYSGTQRAKIVYFLSFGS